MVCESVRPLHKSPKSGEEGFGVEKLPFPSVPEMGALSQKIPIFLVESCRGDFLTQSAHFWGIGKWEFFDPETLFSRFWRL